VAVQDLVELGERAGVVQVQAARGTPGEERLGAVG